MTIKDVAKRADVSLASVSRVLNHADNVSPDIKERVQAAIAELKYNPNLAARALVKKRTKSIGVVVNNLHDPFFYDLLNGFEAGAQTSEYKVLFCSILGGDVREKEKYVKYLTNGVVDGLILYGSHTADEAIVRYLRDNRFVDYAMIENDIPDLNCNKLLVDNFGGTREAVHYLFAHGHTSIAYICGNPNRRVTMDRFSGYVAAMQENGCQIQENFIQHTFTGEPDGYNCAVRLLRAPVRPTAILCSDDGIASYVVRAALDNGLGVPGELSVMWFDNRTILPDGYRGPDITSVAQPLYQIGKESIQLLARRLDAQAPPAPVRKIYETKLAIKDTVCYPGKL